VKRSLALLLGAMLALTLILPGAVLAAGKGGSNVASGRGQTARTTDTPPGVSESLASNGHAAAAQEKKAAKNALKNTRLATKAVRLAAKHSQESSATSPAVNASVEGTKSVGPGVSNALQHIVENLTRKFAKFGEALPQGLVNVWYRFSTWLERSTDTRPWEPVTATTTSGDTPPTEITTVPPSVMPTAPPIDIPLPD
jgi:hypothetical protein